MNIQSEDIKKFNYLVKETDALYHEYALSCNITDSVAEILYVISSIGEGCSQRDICRLSGSSKQTINSAIKKMEREGMLNLRPGHGRINTIYLTERGKNLAEEKIAPLIKMENEVLDSWSDKDRKELLRLTERYLVELRQKIDEKS
ncbi:MAG: MarR family transcriptional regulator [bacterium]|nr:MarR family transcriptional regulator [bacterium]